MIITYQLTSVLQLSSLSKIFLAVVIVHFILSLIYFSLRYKVRMKYLNGNPFLKIRGWKRQIAHFILLLIICLIVGSFLMAQQAVNFNKFRKSYKNIYTHNEEKKSRNSQN